MLSYLGAANFYNFLFFHRYLKGSWYHYHISRKTDRLSVITLYHQKNMHSYDKLANFFTH
uniref:Uncharacterized protein n=1 Tax=Arundo donax TaxID=35708 RepID=A0A0A9CCV8_ARUDO